VILPGLGLGPGVLNDPAKGISFLANSLLPGLIDLIYLGNSLVFALIALALYDRLHHDSPAVMQVVVAAGLVASTLFLAYAMINFVGAPTTVSTFRQDTTVGAAVYVALRTVANGLNAGALFAAGIAVLLSGWIGRATGKLPAILGYTMLVAGTCMALSFALLFLGLLGVLLVPLWSIWLGFVLLRSTASVMDHRATVLPGRDKYG
jgi:hypothetical protein